MSLIRVEVAYALPDQQWLLAMEVPLGTSLLDAAQQAVASGQFGTLNLAEHALGVFGKREAAPSERILADGDRVEIYRALVADPKEIRKARARRTRQASQSQAGIRSAERRDR